MGVARNPFMLGGRVHQLPRGRKDGAMDDEAREGRQLRERQLLNQLADEDYCKREGLLDPSPKLPKNPVEKFARRGHRKPPPKPRAAFHLRVPLAFLTCVTFIMLYMLLTRVGGGGAVES